MNTNYTQNYRSRQANYYASVCTYSLSKYIQGNIDTDELMEAVNKMKQEYEADLNNSTQHITATYYHLKKKEEPLCEEWKDNIEAFIQWGIENGADKPFLYVARKDQSKEYSPDNCYIETEESRDRAEAERQAQKKAEAISRAKEAIGEAYDKWAWLNDESPYFINYIAKIAREDTTPVTVYGKEYPTARAFFEEKDITEGYDKILSYARQYKKSIEESLDIDIAKQRAEEEGYNYTKVRTYANTKKVSTREAYKAVTGKDLDIM